MLAFHNSQKSNSKQLHYGYGAIEGGFPQFLFEMQLFGILNQFDKLDLEQISNYEVCTHHFSQV